MPKPENIELISRFESAIINLNDSTWEYPFGTFLWEVNDKGAFSIEKLFDFMVISEEYHPYKYGEKYRELFNLLHTCLTEFTIYSLTFSAPDAYKVRFQEPLITADNHPPISDIEFEDWVVGKTFDNYWIAIGNVSSGRHSLYKKEPLSGDRESQLERTTLEFLDELGNIIKNFYPKEYLWEIYPTREGVLKRIFSSTRLIISSDFDGLEQRFMLSELPDLPSGQLCQSLQSNLINITEYNLFDYYTYFIGQTHWGDWAGVWTQEPWH